MLKIAVCDDNNAELTQIADLLQQYLIRNHEDARVDLYHNAIELMAALHRESYQALFMDIMMPGFTGMQAAREIRSFNSEIRIVFLTSSPEFAIESYQVDAFYYLLKPITSDDLFPVLNKLMRQFSRAEDALVLTAPSGVMRLPYGSIEILEVNSKHLLFYLNNGTVQEFSGALKDYEPRLIGSGKFLKVHRSYLVNMDSIQQLTGSEATTFSGKTVPVSRLLSNQVRTDYMNYLFRKEGRA